MLTNTAILFLVLTSALPDSTGKQQKYEAQYEVKDIKTCLALADTFFLKMRELEPSIVVTYQCFDKDSL